MDVKINIMRTRWRRWLGQKTRIDKPYWATLLDGNWRGWVSQVYKANNIDPIDDLILTRSMVKDIFRRAINMATLEELDKLDILYCEDKLNL